jgi:membrane protein insertase Oxa1/YidC/SpoIIIJ
LKNYKSIIAILTGLVLIVSTAFAIDHYYAHDTDLAQLSLNFEQYRTDQRLDSIQDRIWQVEDRIKKEGEKPELLERLRELKAEQQKMQDKTKELYRQSR